MVYFIQQGDFIKIGTSKNFKNRYSALQTNTPYELEVVGIIKGGIALEQSLHEKFKKHHRRGEWFYAHSDILDYIASCDDLSWKMGYGEKIERQLNPLKNLRLELSLSMDEAAEKIGITKQSYSETENRCAQGRVTIGALARYAKAFGYKIEYRFIDNNHATS